MVGIRMWTTPESRGHIAGVEHLRLHGASGATSTLGSVAELTRVQGQPQITREDLATLVAVTARISGRDLGSVMHDVRAAVARLPLARGTRVEYGGQYREQQSSFRNLAAVAAAALGLTFALLLVLFGRWSIAAAVLGASLLAAAGVFVGLWATGCELDVSSLMGLTMVVGISAESAVFLVSELATRLPANDPRAALVAAGRARLRPIVMTALAAILALAPLALGLGRGSAMLQPLAVAIASGLVFTVPAVLLLLPSLLSLLLRPSERSLEAPSPAAAHRAI
jgi:multidrug efflux pump subunit AcrB